ncbi:MAG: hypothetical protein Q8O62_09960 [Aequorivita sp.]|nr:hypothetical protein [Aequorivita sp.]
MKTYHTTQPKLKKKISDPAPAKKTVGFRNKIATLASTVFLKVASAFAPLNKFQQALYYEGKEFYSKTKKKKTSFLVQWYKKNQVAFVAMERLLFFAFIIFALFTSAILLLALPVMGALVFYRNRVIWLWWKFKVFVLFRSFYEHRRNLYKQGTLFHHFKNKAPAKYRNAIIWGESISISNVKFKNLQKKNSLTAKEYIHS